MLRLILRGMMLTRFVRVVNNKQKKTAVKVFYTINQTKRTVFSDMCEKF